MVQNFLRKPISEVITVYGKPAYQDKTDPEMICTFYQTAVKKIVFISNSNEVYQAQADISYNSKEEAVSALSKLIDDCSSQGYISDTLKSDKFRLHRKGNIIEVNISPIGGGSKHNISIKAQESED